MTAVTHGLSEEAEGEGDVEALSEYAVASTPSRRRQRALSETGARVGVVLALASERLVSALGAQLGDASSQLRQSH